MVCDDVPQEHLATRFHALEQAIVHPSGELQSTFGQSVIECVALVLEFRDVGIEKVDPFRIESSEVAIEETMRECVVERSRGPDPVDVPGMRLRPFRRHEPAERSTPVR